MAEDKGVGRYPDGIDIALIHLTGTIVTWWARIEGLLVQDLITLRQLPMNAELAAKEPFPSSTNATIKQWHRLQNATWPEEKTLREVTSMVPELRDLAEERHIIVHSFWPWGSDDPETVRIQRVRPAKGGNIAITQYELNVETMDAVNERLCSMYHRNLALSMNLLFQRRRLSKDYEERQ